MTVIAPLQIAPLGASTLRFFRSPRPGADFLWHAFDDLLACMALPRDRRRIFKRKLAADWRAEVKTIATRDGIVTIAPHYMAQGLISAMISEGYVRPSFEHDYSKAGSDALSKITLGWSAGEILAFLAEAHKRDNDGGAA
ncbi:MULTISPECIES: hypothetical protein [Methylosinus]|uniref:Uncharacterized protein n=1 Tax=Methylosinus trichosporium (strain ATCC 35070 / NCIMB 11131 / UNIQEM 75 / OB3b) TaxID=595536 RepID=A0A2D2CVY9_METT3|nr:MULTISPECIES: hypothetical protein [Methylosinus]ATQ66890.1 hypothetical protein CQW49_02500 [Methylosinus trichosporium OB3b]OBS54146.1 hypothetical protein A8B73_02640 [Methylosinus sp. 3S-1]